MRLRAGALLATTAFAAVTLGVSPLAAAQPLPIDHRVPPNGISTPDYPRTPLLTPPASPIQVPAPTVSTAAVGPSSAAIVHRTYVYYPYISRQVHDAIPVPRGAVFEAIGAIAVNLPTGTGGVATINPNGHCIFSGAGADQKYAAAHPEQWIAPPAVSIETPVFELHIEPRLWLPAQRH